MSTHGTFEIEDADIVRLDGRMDGESTGRERAGWVNVGAFAVRIELNDAGDLSLAVYPCGNEQTAFGQISAKHADAMAAGANDTSGIREEGFYIMTDFEDSAGFAPTIEEARTKARELMAVEPFVVNFSIHDQDGELIEDLGRSAGLPQYRPAAARAC